MGAPPDQFNQLGQDWSQPPWRPDRLAELGYAVFVEQKPENSPAEMRTYFRRFAQTLVAAKLLGVNDLHQENVMATEDEPTIIDAETAFLPYVVTARRMTATGVGGALTSFRSMQTQELENNYFVTPEEHAAWQDLSPEEKEQRRLVTYSDYITERRRNDLAGERNYRDSFFEGLETVLGVIDNNQDEIVDMVRDRMRDLKMARVVPFNTMEFTGAIRDYHDWQAPLLLTHDNLPRATRDRLERAACRQAEKLYRVRHLLPQMLNPDLLKVAMVEAVMRRAATA